jgi:uncharacterized membrane protein
MVVDEDRVAELERRTQELNERLERLERGRRPGPERPDFLPPHRPAPARIPASRPPQPWSPPPRERPAFDLARLEALIGGRVIAWVGGVAVVLGLALLASIAASHGWIGPGARTAIAGAASLALAVVGLFVVEHAIPRRALIATGIAGGFVTAGLAGPVYELVPGVVAALGGLAIGAAATALALRLPSRGIAALGLLGGLAAPLLTGAAGDPAAVWLALAAAAAAAAIVVWQRWNWLRAALAVLAVPQVALVALPDAPGPLAARLLALALLGAVLAFAAIGYELRLRGALPRPASAILLLTGAAAVAVVGWFACADAGHDTLGHLWLAGVALAHAAAGVAVRPRRRDLGLLLIAVGVVLADVAAASMADGLVLGLLWSASAAGAAVLARRAGSDHERWLAVTGLAGQAVLAVTHALVSVPPTQVLDSAAPGGALQLGTAVVALALAARLVAPRAPEVSWPLEGAALALLAYLTTALAGDLALVLAFTAQALALDALARRGRAPSPVVRHAAPVFLAAAGGAALLTVAPPDALMTGFAAPLPAAAALAAIALACARVGRLTARPLHTALIAGAAVALLHLGSGLVAWAAPSDQAGQLAVSALWATAGLGGLAAGLAWRRRALRVAGLGLLLVTAAKVFLVDLATLTSVYRVASFVAVGLLLLLGAVVWQRAGAEARG